MKVYYNKTERPTRAGLAKLEYGEQSRPTRRGDIITIPERGFDLYQLTPEMDQFILLGKRTNKKGEWPPGPDRQSTWFGGTDERPFLVELEDIGRLEDRCIPWQSLWKKNSVFDALKPPAIVQLEKVYGKKARRQGDIFAFPSPVTSRDELYAILQSLWGECYEDSESPALFGTRHKLKGTFFSPQSGGGVAKGCITAPDHKDMILKDFHMLHQTVNLKQPKKAD